MANSNELSSPIWVVTTYYNPIGFNRRLQNFYAFRKHLNVPLLVVELSRTGDYVLSDNDADVLVQVTGEDRMWQKERLINLGVASLPDHVKYVAWVDCDVIFLSQNWAQESIALLEESGGAVQLFDRVFHAEKCFSELVDKNKDCLTVDYLSSNSIFNEFSIASKSKKGFSLPGGVGRCSATNQSSDGQDIPLSPGMAWAMSKSFFDRLGLYDAAIVGGGDDFFLAGLIGSVVELSESFGHSKLHQLHASQWADRFDDLMPTERKISNIAGDLVHLWHGDFNDRQYLDRQALLSSFDPFNDLVSSGTGPWEWRMPDSILATSIGRYFESRNEDG